MDAPPPPDDADAVVAALERAGLVLLWTPETGYVVRPRGATVDDRFTPGGHLVFHETRESERFENWGRRRFGAQWRHDDAMNAAADLLRTGWLEHARMVAVAEDDDQGVEPPPSTSTRGA